MKPTTLAKAIACSAAISLGYLTFARPQVLNWGATEAEVDAPLPGDDILPNANLQTTRAITIESPPERIWPWLVQMGPRPRAGVYTYDWLERLLGIDIENANRILPEFQHIEPGQFFAIGNAGNGLHVHDVQPERALVLQWSNEQSSWAFVLNPQSNGTTRLISRNRILGSGPSFRIAMAFMEPASLVMERKMLHGIKQRAESQPQVPPATTTASDNGH